MARGRERLAPFARITLARPTPTGARAGALGLCVAEGDAIVVWGVTIHAPLTCFVWTHVRTMNEAPWTRVFAPFG